jgi:superfamily II DNA or RNA helicase
MSIVLRTYQEKALSQLGNTKTQVLSICPGGGKTYTAIEFALRNPQFKKVLILTHGTNVLKTQWSDDFATLGMTFSNELHSDERFTITIPHAILKKDIPKFDLIIVDEAHEFYYVDNKNDTDGMLKTIIKKVKPKCQLFLTGTPSKFIKNEMKPVIVSGCEIYGDKEGKKYLSNTYFGLVKSAYVLDTEDFDSEGDTASFEFTKKDTKESLLSLVKEMLNRLETNKKLKSSPNAINVLGAVKLNRFQKAFGGLGKTLIAARNIAHANVLKELLQANKVSVVVSESKGDKDSENIAKFKDDPAIQALIVVRRGILGFNMPTLVNVVDFTMSRNIDRIYQLYARVLRVHPDGKEKFYFKMCSYLNAEVDAVFFQAAICLNNPDFISKYNGKNLKELPIFVRKESEKKEKSEKSDKKKSKAKNISMDGNMMDFVISLDLMTELTVNPKSKHWKEFKYTTVAEALTKLTGVEFQIEWGKGLDRVVAQMKQAGIMK